MPNAEEKILRRIRHYNNKVGASAAGGINWNSSMSLLSFSFTISIAINIDIEINISITSTQKSLYGEAQYGVSLYDPLTALGVIVPDTLTKYLLLQMIRSFIPATYRGVKYALPVSFFYLNANLPVLETFAPDPVWTTRFRKMEGARNWTFFLDMGFLDVNALPLEPCTLVGESTVESAFLIRVSDILTCLLDFETLDGAYLDYPPFDFNAFGNLFPHDPTKDNLTSNLLDHMVLDRTPIAGTEFPYPEVYLLAQNVVAYEPVLDVMCLDYDVLFSTVGFDEGLIAGIIDEFKGQNNPVYRTLTWFTGSDRMKAKYAAHATFQGLRTDTLQRVLEGKITSPTQFAKYNAFMMEYTYKRKQNQLVSNEAVIQKYVRLGLDESLLRQIAAFSLR